MWSKQGKYAGSAGLWMWPPRTWRGGGPSEGAAAPAPGRPRRSRAAEMPLNSQRGRLAGQLR